MISEIGSGSIKAYFIKHVHPGLPLASIKDSEKAIYVVLEGYRLSDGRIYAVNICPVCGKALWVETSRNF